MTKEELAKWKHLCRESTPGPWYHVQVANWWEVQHGPKYEDTRLTDADFDNRAEYNAHLMAESRTAIPKLLDEIERLQAENETLKPKSSLCCCACCDAFHESGIDPADLPKFIEAVRQAMITIAEWHGDVAWEIYRDNAPEMKAIREAAACLPEKRGGK